MVYLIEVVVCGEKSDGELDYLSNFLVENYKETFKTNNENIKLFSQNVLPHFESKRPIIIFKNSCSLSILHNNIPESSICILNPQNLNAINQLSNKNITALSCGMSNKDTLNISSINYPKAVVSLQRTIKNIHNKTVEPKDIIIDLQNEYDPYSILASCALFLLLQTKDTQQFSI